jgi:hypothetical protein
VPFLDDARCATNASMEGTYSRPAEPRGRVRVVRGSQSLLIGLVCGAAFLACGKKRPFGEDTSPLQPERGTPVETGADAAVDSFPSDATCGLAGCPRPLTCDTSSGRCVECLTSNDCASPEVLCDTATHSCVRCLANEDCPSTSPICKLSENAPQANRCVECTGDSECLAPRPACDPSSNQCSSRCTVSTQCPPPTPVCNDTTQVCVGCVSNADCSETANVCDPSTARCVECLDDGGCAGGQVCNIDTHTCVDCLDNTQCLDGLNAHCQLSPSAAKARFTCVGCVEDRDCIDKPGLGGFCRLDDARCVDCLGDADCVDSPAASNCSSDGACVGCATDGDCSLIPGRTACLASTGCVECVEASHCAGNPEEAVCKSANVGQAAGDAPTNTCVECTSNNDCASPGASRCENNRCVECSANADCAHVESTADATRGTALTVCDAGTCVECTGLQRAACGANVCDSLNRRCSILTARTAEPCEACVSDAHCALDARCVRQVVAGSDLGFFCLPLATGAPPSCGRVFVEPVASNTMDQPGPEVVCLLRRTSCEGFNDFSQLEPCTADDDCGVRGLADGLCNEQFGQCTIPCNTLSDCIGDCQIGACEL